MSRYRSASEPEDGPAPHAERPRQRLAWEVHMSEPIRVIPADALVDADPTPGMRRQQAVDVPGLWSGMVHTEPGATSGWHHHGEHETSLYVISGVLRLDFGPGGQASVDAGPGQFVHVPAQTIHRESNPTGRR
jgi:Cupin domain